MDTKNFLIFLSFFKKIPNQILAMILQIFVYVLLMSNAVSSLGLPKKFEKRFDSLKKKMNKFLKGKKGDEILLNLSDIEYPKVNKTLRQAYKEQWQEYYKCLKKRLNDAGPEKTIYPVALMALERTTVTLKCKLCISPAELHVNEAVEWLYNSTSNKAISNMPIQVSEHALITPDTRDLNLYNVQLADSGIYWCQLDDTMSLPYFLHVVNEENELMRPVKPETAASGNYSALPENLEEYNLRVFSLWTPWSPCSTCGKVGKRVRYGYCTLSLISGQHRRAANEYSSSNVDKKKEIEKQSKLKNFQNQESNSENFYFRRKRAENEIEKLLGLDEKSDVKSKTDNKKKKLKSPKEIKKLAQSVLPVFHNRLPCRAPQIPRAILKIPEIGERGTEVMTGFCKVKCHKDSVFEVRDESGKVLESANNSAGVYSMLQGLPEPESSIERTTIYRKHKKKAEIACPGTLNSDIPVTWQVGTKVMIPSMIKEQTKNRISIDSRQRILIDKLQFADANIYSCWQRGQLVGTIRLQVTQEIELKIDHRVFMIGAIIILATMLRVFWRAFVGRKRFTIH